MPTILAEEFSAAMTALLAAASASDAREWMNVASEVRKLQSRCSAIIHIIQDEAEADALAIDGDLPRSWRGRSRKVGGVIPRASCLKLESGIPQIVEL